MSQLTVSLIKPVIRALALAGVTQKELLGGTIEHTDLVWQVPPLRSDVMLHGAPVAQYLQSRPPFVNPDKVYEMWVDVMRTIRHAPYKVCSHHGYRALSYCLPKVTQGERLYWFTAPEGFPQVDEYVGARLSIEAAFVISLACPVQEIVDDEDNFYVVTEEGHEIGVRDGLPIVEGDQWDLPVSGMVQDLMRITRGVPFNGCDYDLLAKLRSVAWSHKDMVQDFDGVDMALQALRVLANGKHLPELQAAISHLHVAQRVNEHRLKTIQEAIEVSQAFAISDRARVVAIRALLVPEILAPSAFKRKLFSADRIPPAMTDRSREKLREGLYLLLEEERKK
jgi:hypothetical protein